MRRPWLFALIFAPIAGLVLAGLATELASSIWPTASFDPDEGLDAIRMWALVAPALACTPVLAFLVARSSGLEGRRAQVLSLSSVVVLPLYYGFAALLTFGLGGMDLS